MMTRDMLYSRVSSVCPMERTDFEEDLVCAVNELCAMFGEKYVMDETSDLTVDCAYFTALCSAILYFRMGDQSDRRRFIDRAKQAFLTIWKARAKERRKGDGDEGHGD
ncbi:MAG: hypothetical protein J6M12_04885 [Clostridia bacterium]|nr:hypothetical protein [Clostridia bacterium]